MGINSLSNIGILLVNSVENTDVDVDKIKKELPTFLTNLIEKAQGVAIRLAISVVIYFVARKVISKFSRFVEKVLDRSKVETSVSKFMVSCVRTICYIIMALLLLRINGIESTSFAALIGSAGLTLGLALQGSLQNFSGGVLILLLKPFRVGDYIIVDGFEGTVETIDIFYTKLLTIDNRVVVLPNGTLSNTNITNVTKEEIRRLDITVSIEYSENIQKVKDLLTRISMSKDPVLKDHDVNVYVDAFEASSIRMGIRVWCNTEDYWPLRWDMLESIKNEFDANDITIPFDQLDINLKERIKAE